MFFDATLASELSISVFVDDLPSFDSRLNSISTALYPVSILTVSIIGFATVLLTFNSLLKRAS